MTNKKSNCGCLTRFFPCLPTVETEDTTGKYQSKKIDKEIAKEKKNFEKTCRVLLLGAGESGKSTILKQMQLIHVDKFSDTLRKQRKNDIRNNLVDAIVSILGAMPNITPPVKLDSSEHERMGKWILNQINNKKEFECTLQFFEYTKKLWKDNGVQATFVRSNEYQLIDSAKYFLDKIDEISLDDYMPTDQDILRCRVITTTITDVTFQDKGVRLQIIDVGGQREERRKWFLCFNDVTAIIFVAACNSYDMVLREDFSKNRLVESLDLFKTIWNNRWLGHISVILFLNKQDLFKEKILSGRSKLEDYFPDFARFKYSFHHENDRNEDPEVILAKRFLQFMFEKISISGNDNPCHRCFPHFTCAIDTDNIKRVFQGCREIIQRIYLVNGNLL